MDEYQEIANAIFQDFMAHAQDQGLTITGMDNETGQLHIPNHKGETLLVSLNNLIDYYYQTRDENAVTDFVAKIVVATKPQEEPSWDEAKANIYVSLYPTNGEMQPQVSREVTAYFKRLFILDTPQRAIWVMPEMLEKWGVSEEELEQQAFDNANRLLTEVELEIGDVGGHPLGSFRVHDRTLNAALLFAPDLKAKVSSEFGWPIYAIIPDKVTCYFFGKEHYEYFEGHIGSLVAEKYEGSRYVTPELLEFNDDGVRSICSWTNQMGYIVKFDS